MTLDGQPEVEAQPSAAGARRRPFGTLPDGTPIEAVELDNGAGVTARIITLGATLQALVVPDRDGRRDDVVLGYDSAAEYLAQSQYIGVTVGRYANRIARGRFALDGEDFALETNDGPNHLHGGKRGFDKMVWEIAEVGDGAAPGVTLNLRSPDGDGGYPGALDVTARYALEGNVLAIEFCATTTRPTIVNLTNHSYFNLAGGGRPGDVLGHRLSVAAEAFTPVDATLIPSGELRPVTDTPFDFCAPEAIGARIGDEDEQLRLGGGYDHNFVLGEADGALRVAARLEEPESGRTMELLTTAPGLQFYSGNFLDGSSTGKGGRVHHRNHGLCLEPQVFPDAPNRPDFPSARLDPGETYVHRMALRFL